VKEQADAHGVTIIHDDRHLESYAEQVEIFEHANAAICLNRSHTFGMVVMQGMSCGLPTLCQRYSGFTDYTSDLFNLSIEFDVTPVTENDIQSLVGLGMKNHLFPINDYNYPFKPFWSTPRIEDVKKKMQIIVDDARLRETLTKMSDLTASWFSWERTALNMSFILTEWSERMSK
jgi:glycosyltransferase involved in cell wall biosynthesis